jgi:hypothetical protein
MRRGLVEAMGVLAGASLLAMPAAHAFADQFSPQLLIALGGLVACLPMVVYEFAHIVNSEYPDE